VSSSIVDARSPRLIRMGRWYSMLSSFRWVLRGVVFLNFALLVISDNSKQHFNHAQSPQDRTPTPTPCPGSIPEAIGRQILRIASQEKIDPTLLSVTMRHESSFGKDMRARPRKVGKGRNRRLVGWDVGPMQTGTNIWGKSPFIDGLSDPFGTVSMEESTHKYSSFKGNFEDKITLDARAFSMDILPRSE